MTEQRTITEGELRAQSGAVGVDPYDVQEVLERLGITVVTDPAPLPIKPGVYMSGLLGIPLWLMDDGRWRTSRTLVHDPARHMPLERLETRSEGDARVLATLRAKRGIADHTLWPIASIERVLREAREAGR